MLPKASRPTGNSNYEVPADLSPRIRNALISFLIGSSDQINSGRLTELFNEGRLVFTSSQSLDGLEALINKYNQKPQYHRQDRFPEQMNQRIHC